MSLENAFATKAVTVIEATGYMPPATPREVTAKPLPVPTTQQTLQPTFPSSITVSPSTQESVPVGITLTAEQWAAYTSTQNRVVELEEIERKRASDAQAAEVKALQAKGQIEAAFNLQREQARLELEAERKRLKDTEDRAKRYALDGELARALASQPLVSGGAEQLTRLWRDQFSVDVQGDSFAVRTPDFQPVSSWIAAQLDRPEYAHFLRAQNPNGGTAGGPPGLQGLPTAPAVVAPEKQPANLSEAVLMTLAAREKNGADPRLTPALGFGLRAYPPSVKMG
jgi:hypothetical protein